jgi:hypothetical protein
MGYWDDNNKWTGNEKDNAVKSKYEKFSDDVPPGAVRNVIFRIIGSIINCMLISSYMSVDEKIHIDFGGTVLAGIALVCSILPTKLTTIPMIIVTIIAIAYRTLLALGII